MTERESNVYEMLWDCKFCGEKKLLGKTHRFCPTCGAAQDPDARYFPTEAEQVAVHDHHYVGADLTCPACGGLNVGDATYCTNCGAPLDKAERATTINEQYQEGHEIFEGGRSRDLVKEQFDKEMQRVGVQPKPGERKGLNWKVIGIVGVIIAVIAAIIVALTWTRETGVFVVGHSWERIIQIQDFDVRFQEGWDETVPSDAYRVSCSRRQRGTERIPDGETCENVRIDQGDGTFRTERRCTTNYREEPVYDQYCTYSVDRWANSRSVPTSGSSVTDVPYWAEVTLNCEGQNRIGCERISARNEVYNVIFQGEGETRYTCPFPQNEWQNIGIESAWTLRVRVVDADAGDCDSLQPAS